MTAIIIKSNNAHNLKLLAEIAEQMGEEVGKISESQIEDIALGMLIKKSKKQQRQFMIFQILKSLTVLKTIIGYGSAITELV
jgi:hypothetical protein